MRLRRSIRACSVAATRASLAVIALWLAASPAAAQGEPAPDAPASVEAASVPEISDVPPPPAPVELRPATVRFSADREGIFVCYVPDPVLEDTEGGGVAVRLAEPGRYTPLCEAPCERDLPQAHFALAFERGGVRIRLREPFGVDGPTGVRIRWDDRSDERLGGVLALAIGIPLGLLVGGVPTILEAGAGDPGTGTGAGLGIGGAIVAAAVVVGVLLVLREDDASFSVTPLPADAPPVFSGEWR